MWSDNETDVDLLGFGYLVDSLDILLTEEALLPLTVGVYGDWGSGKSSLMRIARRRLEQLSADAIAEAGGTTEARAAAPFLCVEFSPWRFEDYTHIKLALMTAVVDALTERVDLLPPDEDPRGPRARLRRLKALFSTLKALTPFAAPAAALVTTAVGAPPAALPMAAAGAAVASTAIAKAAEKTEEALAAVDAEPEAQPDTDAFESISEFHIAFSDLVESLPGLQAVVVFIDDMDRCTTQAIVDCFEAIRLFLHAPKTAYVLGINEPIIIAALEERYPARTDADASRGQHYLEKMLQTSVSIPPLSEPEALAYVTFLYAQRHVGDAEYERLRTAADRNRKANPNGEIMNEGLARAALDVADLDETLSDDLRIAAQVGVPLAQGLRGNPRQIKRFLNTLELRRRVAERRALSLDPAKLAKLMVLEETSLDAFETLYHWQIAHDGLPPHLQLAEDHARETKAIKGSGAIAKAAKQWATQSKVQEWLRADPPLAGEPLSAYFTFSRDRMTTTVRAARLSPEQQEILGRLRNDIRALRETGVTDALALDERLLAEIVAVLAEELAQQPGSLSARSLIDIAAKHPSSAATLFEELKRLSPRRATRNLVLWLRGALPEDPRTDETIATFAAGNEQLRAAAQIKRTT